MKKIIYTQDTHYNSESENPKYLLYADTQEGKRLPIEHCIYGTWGHKVCDDITQKFTISDDEGILKHTFGSFELIEMIQKMIDAGTKHILVVVDVQNDFVTGALRNEAAIAAMPNVIEKIKYYEDTINKDDGEITIEFIGFCTDICAVSNVIITKTAFPEVRIIVDPLCCAGVTPESHDAAILTMKMCQIDC